MVRRVDAQELLEERPNVYQRRRAQRGRRPVRNRRRRRAGRRTPTGCRSARRERSDGRSPSSEVLVGPVIRVDLQRPRQVGQLAWSSWFHQFRCARWPGRAAGPAQRVEEEHDVQSGAADDDSTRERAEECRPGCRGRPSTPRGVPAASATALRSTTWSRRRRAHAVAERDAPDGDARDELPLAAERSPALAGQPDARPGSRRAASARTCGASAGRRRRRRWTG